MVLADLKGATVGALAQVGRALVALDRVDPASADLVDPDLVDPASVDLVDPAQADPALVGRPVPSN